MESTGPNERFEYRENRLIDNRDKAIRFDHEPFYVQFPISTCSSKVNSIFLNTKNQSILRESVFYAFPCERKNIQIELDLLKFFFLDVSIQILFRLLQRVGVNFSETALKSMPLRFELESGSFEPVVKRFLPKSAGTAARICLNLSFFGLNINWFKSPSSSPSVLIDVSA